VFYSLFCIFMILFNNFHHFRQSKIKTFKTAVLHGSVSRLWRIFKDPVIIEGEAPNQNKGVKYEIIKVIPWDSTSVQSYMYLSIDVHQCTAYRGGIFSSFDLSPDLGLPPCIQSHSTLCIATHITETLTAFVSRKLSLTHWFSLEMLVIET
jgi:hypothetical protein